MPATPTEQLVVTGFNRYVRNPMYLGFIVVILGQALLFSSPWLVLYAALFWALTATFVRVYEQPTLTRRYGAQYTDYCAHVPAWLPRKAADWPGRVHD